VELLGLSFVLDDDDGFIIRSGFHFEGPGLHILLNNGILEFSSDQSFGIEDGVDGVFGDLILGSISNESFSFSEADIGWGGSVSLIVSDDLNSLILPDAYTRVGGAEVNTDGFSN
jgi:hypothetical protein